MSKYLFIFRLEYMESILVYQTTTKYLKVSNEVRWAGQLRIYITIVRMVKISILIPD